MPTTRPSGTLLGEQAGEPAGAAAHVEDIVGGSEVHAVEHGEDDGEMVVLHALAAAGFGPAVELLAEAVVLRGFGHLSGELLTAVRTLARSLHQSFGKDAQAGRVPVLPDRPDYSSERDTARVPPHRPRVGQLNGTEPQRLKPPRTCAGCRG